MNFLNIRILFGLLCLSMVTITGCDNQEMNNTEGCIVGAIVNDSLYKIKYEGCYGNSLWIEVKNSSTLGKDVPMPSIYPGGEGPSINYYNVIDAYISKEISSNKRLDTLLGKKIYFNYRFANENEINEIRNNECAEVYETHDVPVIILTDFSFDECPSKRNVQ